VAHFGSQRQFLTALGQRAHQRAHAHAGLRAHGRLAEFQDLVERAGGSTVVPPSPPTQRVCE
jgi:hypothetical protein